MEEQRKQYKDIELRSEEVQEVMNRIPPAILRCGIGVLLCTVVALLAGSAFFRYPDTVEAGLTLTVQPFPAYLPAGQSGRMEAIYVRNGQAVEQGEVLAVIESTAGTEDLLYLKGQLEKWKRKGSRTERIDGVFFRHMAELGNVQPAYSACLLAWNNYLQNRQDGRRSETELVNAIAALAEALAQWEKECVSVAPIKGTVAFMQPWRQNQYVEAGETLFVVMPDGPAIPMGKARVPMEGIGKVATGQRVIVRLPAFPEQEFGLVQGEVSSISPVPDSEGYYVLEVIFPEGLRTSYGKKIPPIKSLTGTASIVTQERSLLERLILQCP